MKPSRTPLVRRPAGIVITVALLLGGVLVLLLRLPGQVRLEAHEDVSPRASASGESVLPSPEALRDSRSVALPEPEPERQELVAAAKAPAFISGVVLGPTGTPVEAATCRLLHGRAPLGLDSLLLDPAEDRGSARIEASTVTDALGQFRLEASPGHWTLRVEAEGARRFEEDHLEPGDFRWVRLEAAIELRVRVVDRAGGAIRGARVELLHDEYAPSHLAVAHAQTGPGGSASLPVPSGPWMLGVRHPDHRPHFERLVVDPGSVRLEEEIVLSPGIRVFGRVSVRGNASPPAGTRVALDSIHCFKESLEIACAADGSFSTGHVFSDAQVLEVATIAPGFAEVRKELDLGRSALDGEGMDENGEVEIHLSLERSDRAAHGRVVDSRGDAIARVSVFLKPLLGLPAETETEIPADPDRMTGVDPKVEPQESYQTQWRWITRTDERGEFRVAGMDYRRPYSLLVVSGRHGNVRLWVDAADSAREIDLGTVVLPAGARIHGVVRALDGRSVAGLAVSAIWLERVLLRAGTTFKNERPSALTGGFQTTTNLDSQFVIAPLPEGEFFLYVAREQFGPFTVRSGEDRGPEVLEIGRDPEADGQSAMSGRVVDDGGKPVVDGFVQLYRETRPNALELLAAKAVDAQGGFQLSAAAPGPFLFRARDIAGGFEQETIRFESVEEWNAGDIVLLPDPLGGARVSGKALGPSGEALANMRVTLHVSPAVTACTCVSRSDLTDRDGGFDFGPIAAGAHRIVVVDPEGRFRPLDRFPVRPGDSLELRLEE